jgi:hypothetical protein
VQENSFYSDLFHVPLSKKEKAVAEVLAATPCDSAWIACYLGTEDLSRARVFVSKLRRKLRGTRWRVTMNEGGRRSLATYKLERG